jgi:diaminohydroxyphosphoribosylaminopyrimidine deaminase / 5-amino-6-(5-phosphoribosylamino)uracil reductase
MVIDDTTAMRAALTAAATVRTTTSPNPWVGAVVVTADGIVGIGATEPPGGRHAEIVALAAAGDAARGATVVCTLEPCSHHGRTPPCTDALIAAGVRRVVVGVVDPDDRVAGAGIAALRAAGIAVDVGLLADEVTGQLAAYLHHRRTGRPYVVCKLAMSLDGGTAAPDGSSRWITGEEARRSAHQLRAESDAIAVGAGTVRADDPALTVRHVEGADPLRVVLGSAPADARVHPCLQWHGDLDELLDDLGRRGVVQLMVEGGARVIGSFHRSGLVDRYVLYVAPALFGGRDAAPAIGGQTATTIADIWRGRFESVERVGADLRIEIVPHEERT